MRHTVNFGLLFCFATLATTGVLAFMRPFSITNTRVHIVFGTATLLLVGMHLAVRVPYFAHQLRLRGKGGSRVSPLTLIGVVAAWAVLLWNAQSGTRPADDLVDLSYEARHRAAIVRSSPLAGFRDLTRHERHVARQPDAAADVALSLYVEFAESLSVPPSIAVWAETSTGAMIETLYLPERLAFSETPEWAGQPTPRAAILPLWRHRYTLISGIDPQGKVDTLTAATPTHSFSLDDYLTLGEAKEFVLCVEVNAPHDPNDAHPDPHIGQPSLLYTAYIEVGSEQPYAILELTGHGGGAEQSGDIHYDLENFTTAKSLIELLLAKTEPLE